MNNTADWCLILPLLIPLVSATLCLFFRVDLEVQRRVSLAAMILLTVASAMLLGQTLGGEIHAVSVGGWQGPFGIVLVGDLLSSIMLMACSAVSLAVMAYGVGQLPELESRRFFHPLALLLVLGVNGSILTGDLFNLYVWFEVMLLASFVLLALGRRKDQLEGALKYVTLNLVASLIFLSAVGILYGKLGTLNMADLAAKLAEEQDSFLVNSSAVLLLVAFGIKAALFPFFFWLPASYHTPAVTISALFAGLLTKVGVYAILRVFTLIFDIQTGHLQTVLVWIAGFTMVVGVLGAAAHFEIKRILSFHIVSQIGYMIMGITFLTPLALGGVIFFIVHNMVAKTNLFLIAGIVEKKCGTTDLNRTGGLFAQAPGLSALFLVSAIALAGLPPLSGFWAKFTLVKAGFEVEAFWIVGISLAVGIMTLFSMTKIWAEAFWKSAPEDVLDDTTASQPISSWLMTPVVIFAAVAACMGLFAEPFLNTMTLAGEQLLEPRAYIEAVLNPQGGKQ
ncbi:MAG: Na+/H+ antiporter subunit D [Verrucomicrobiota bacterium]